ncbi:MAG: SDR family NAD(P)-dependent oxidoreductase [Sandaracinaceae bacterium]
MLQRGEWALVTGASSGIGEAIARRLAMYGVSMVLTARSEAPLVTLAGELSAAHGVGTRVLAADLATPGGIDGLIDAVRALELPIAHLVGNAGYGAYGPSAGLGGTVQRQMVTVNCEAIVGLTRALVPEMLERGQGGVLNVASTAAFQPAGGSAVYAASKAFVLHYTEALHEELRESPLHVTALCPGPVPTNFQARAGRVPASPDRPMACTAGQVAEEGVEAYRRGDAICIPGRLNQLGAVIAQKAPRPLVRRLAHRLMSGKAKA